MELHNSASHDHRARTAISDVERRITTGDLPRGTLKESWSDRRASDETADDRTQSKELATQLGYINKRL